jgi:hypothetical protein
MGGVSLEYSNCRFYSPPLAENYSASGITDYKILKIYKKIDITYCQQNNELIKKIIT